MSGSKRFIWVVVSEKEIKEHPDRVKEAFSQSRNCYIQKGDSFFEIDPETFEIGDEISFHEIIHGGEECGKMEVIEFE